MTATSTATAAEHVARLTDELRRAVRDLESAQQREVTVRNALRDAERTYWSLVAAGYEREGALGEAAAIRRAWGIHGP